MSLSYIASFKFKDTPVTTGTLDITLAKVSVVKGAGKDVACP